MLGRACLLITATAVVATAAPATAATTSPAAHGSGERVRVVVTLDVPGAQVMQLAQSHARAAGGRVLHAYTHALQGYAMELPAGAAAAVARLPRVRAVQPDLPVRASEVQPSPPIGLDRIDQRTLPLSASYGFTRTGAGVTAYVVDTGIRLSHVDFQGRARTGIDVITAGGAADDCNGHGTHVAGTVGGRLSGVAKGVSLVAVRVLGCEGSGDSSALLAGLDHVVRDHRADQPAVAVLSLGGPPNDAVDTAVRQVVADGITVAVAAGNEALDACGVSPARLAEVVTVSATDSRNADGTVGGDVRADFANFGDCVQIFAPGVRILSNTITSDTATSRASGTSMAAPHVAGAAALHLQDEPLASPARIKQLLLQEATAGVVGDSRSRTSDLLFVASGEQSVAEPAPQASPAPAAAASPSPETAASPAASPASSPTAEAAPSPTPAPASGPATSEPPPPSEPTAAPASPAAPAPSPSAASPASTPAPALADRPDDALGRFTPVSPVRVLDTRTSASGRLTPGVPLPLQLTGRAGVPAAGATAVALNVTVVGADGVGHLTVYPGDLEPPPSSTINYRAAQIVPNAAVTGLSAEGRVALRAIGGAPHVLVDVVGYYADRQGGSRSFALDPARLLDTRTALGGLPGRLPSGAPVELQVTGRGGVPADGVTAVVVNVTAVAAEGRGHVTAFPAGTALPVASTLNFVRGQAVPNLAIVQVGRDGRVAFQASSGAPHLVVDVVAWYSDTVDVRKSSRFQPLPPERVLDTRDGTGAAAGRVLSGRPVRLRLAGRGGVPGVGVTAVVLNVTVVAPTGTGHLTLFPPDSQVPLASNLNYVRGQTVSNLVFAKVGVDAEVAVDILASSGDPHVIADVVGYTVG